MILQQYRIFYIFTLPLHIPRMWVIFYPKISPSWVKSSCLRHLNSRRCLEYYAKSRVSLWLRKRIRQLQSLPRGESRENYFTSLLSLSPALSLSLSLLLSLSLSFYGFLWWSMENANEFFSTQHKVFFSFYFFFRSLFQLHFGKEVNTLPKEAALSSLSRQWGRGRGRGKLQVCHAKIIQNLSFSCAHEK